MTTFDLQRAAMSILGATAAEKHVLLVLALRANDKTATCTPGMPRIAKDTGLSERTVHRTIAALEKAGHISRKVKDGIGTTYTVHPCHDVTPDTVSPLTESQATPDTVSGKLPRTTISSSKTSSSPKRAARSARALPQVEVKLPDWIPVEAWEGWLEMRRTKGAKPTSRALALSIEHLRKLADAGHPPGDVLDQSTRELWLGLFPIKDSQNEQSRSTRRPQANRNSVGDAVLAAHDRVDFG